MGPTPDKFDLERSAASVETVLNICGRRGRVLLLIQDNPDPDALASASALRELIHQRLKKRAYIAHGGVCGRAENRAMVRLLHIDTRRIAPENLGPFTTVGLLDTQPQFGNNVLLGRRPAQFVIDHHLLPKRASWQAEFTDIRPDYGATATILYEYLLCANIRVSANLATALAYGIQSDTQYLGREAGPADTAAFLELFRLADKKKLSGIRQAVVPAEYFQMLHDGLESCVVAGSTVISFIRSCANPDMIAEVAELLLRLEGAHSSVCYGVVGDSIHLSARAADCRGNVFRRIRRVVGRLGTGGGHRTSAGGQIPLQDEPEKRLALVRSRIMEAFAAKHEPKPLLGTS
jgi:nanoRNase/pAp phosphatase (c-di-AMP/oligoRNAs hydrolase)